MISWIQKYFQKHFRLVFGTILLAMAVPLVVIYSQSAGIGRASARTVERPFFGYNLGNEEVMNRTTADAARSMQLKGSYQSESAQIQQYALIRLAGLSLADRLHLPDPGEKEVGAYIATLPVFKDLQGNFDQKRYGDFAERLKASQQFTVADANRVFRDDTRLDALDKVLGGPGYVLPADLRDILTRTDTKWSVVVATFDYASFDPGLVVGEDVLKKFFEENSDRYEVSPRIGASAVTFHATEFNPPVGPTEEQLRAYYNANPARFPAPPGPDDKAPAKPAAPVDNFTKARPQIEAAMLHEAGLRDAMKAASDFSIALYGSKAPANSPELASFLSSQHRAAIALPPFSPEAPPAGLAWASAYGDAISRLNRDRYFSDPLTTSDGVIVLLWSETLPSYKPLLTEVHDKVAADYRDGEKRKRFVAQGRVLRARLEAAVKAGTPFEKAAAAEKIEVRAYAGFTLAEPPKDAPAAALRSVSSLNAGQIGEMISSGDKGYFVYVAQKQLPDLTPANPRFADLNARVGQSLSEITGNAILTSLVETELQKTAPATSSR